MTTENGKIRSLTLSGKREATYMEPSEILSLLRNEGNRVMDAVHPCDGDRQENHFREELPDLVKTYILDKDFGDGTPQYRFIEAFKAVHSRELRQNDWTGVYYQTNNSFQVTLEGPLNEFEDWVKMLLPGNMETFKRRLNVHRVNPIKEYLTKLRPPTEEDYEMFHNLAKACFGSNDPFDQTLLSKWLIGAVARAVQPGCKMDTALVLRGKQGARKTSFLQALAGDYFKTIHSHQNLLEQQRAMQHSWMVEYGEIEATFKAKDISALKAFITETHDTYRDLNKELGAARPRHCVFAGTTNQRSFLNDPTGARRFFIIDIGENTIPTDWVLQNRDRIWSVAYALYRSRETWWLHEAEEEELTRRNTGYQVENTWVEPLESAIESILSSWEGSKAFEGYDSIAFKSSDMLKSLGVSAKDQGSVNKKFKDALETLGYEQKSIRVKGKPVKLYRLKTSEKPMPVFWDMQWRVHLD